MGAILKRLRPTYRLPLVLAAAGVLWGLLLGRLSFPNVLMLIALSVAAVGSLLEPLVGVGIALFLGPFWAWLPVAVPQVPPLIGQYVFLLTIGAWIIRGLLRRSLRFLRPPLLLPLLLFMGVTLLSLWKPVDVWVGWWEWAKWGQILLMFLLVYERLTEARGTTERLGWPIALLALPAVFQATLGVWQSVWWGGAPENFAIDEHFFRAYGTFQQPNPFAGFLGIIGALLAGLLMGIAWDWIAEKLTATRQKSKMACCPSHVASPHPAVLTPQSALPGLKSKIQNPKWLLVPAVALIGAGLFASWSRGAWMGFGAALLVMAMALPKRGMWGVLLVLALVVGGLGLYGVGLLPDFIANRLVGFMEYVRFTDVRGVAINDANFSVLERMAHWQAALSMWREHFWLGVGFGCYEAAYPAHRLINWPLALGHAHNYYLNLLAETGVLGLLAYLVWLGSIFVGLWRASRRVAGLMRGLALGLVGAWTHFNVHNFVDNILVNNVHLHLGVLLALSAWVIGLGGADEGVDS
ncbi:MAG: O-antigen ligase family protein [Anaerolineae bacterium]